MLTKLTQAPVFFLSHGGGPAAFLDFKGSPFQDIDKSSKGAAFLRNLDSVVKEAYNGQSVKSILVVTAHWEEREITVDYQTGKTRLHYDYYGFPEEAYAPHLTYPAPTDVKLADRAYQLISSSGLKAKLRPRDEGYDHGVFIPLKLAYPAANIPVVQVSLNSNLDIATHIQLGEALAPLRNEGVLIIGSGQISHNLGAMRASAGSGTVDQRTVQFTDWFRDLLEGTNAQNYEERKQQLIASPKLAPHFAFQHPRTEHFVPLAVAFGAARPQQQEDGDEKGSLAVWRVFHDIAMGNMATDSYLFV